MIYNILILVVFYTLCPLFPCNQTPPQLLEITSLSMLFCYVMGWSNSS